MSSQFGDPRLPRRFWDKVTVDPETNCWLWGGFRAGKGYGGYKLFGETAYSHRIAYEFLVNTIPPGLQIDHLCRVRHCCNPDHLEVVTARENLLRGTTLTALYASRSLCRRGHPLDGMRNNKARYAAGKPRFRYCLTCNREWQRQIRRRRKDEQRATR